MAVTRLKRKGRKNKTVSRLRNTALKVLTKAPVIKNVDIEALKASFKKEAVVAPSVDAAVEATPAKKKATKKAADTAAE